MAEPATEYVQEPNADGRGKTLAPGLNGGTVDDTAVLPAPSDSAGLAEELASSTPIPVAADDTVELPASPSATDATPIQAEVEADPVPSAAALRSGPYASVHSDANHGTMIGQLFEAVQRHSGAPLRAESVARELADYLPIGNEGEVAQVLKDNRVAVLVADHLGSGRWTSALQLLTNVQGEPLILRRVRREVGDSFSMEGLRGNKRTGWILDLRETEESVPASCDFGLELQQADDLRDDDSYLIVLVGAELWARIGNGAGGLAKIPAAPDAIELFTKYLETAGITDPKSWAEDHRLSKDLPQLRPGQVKEWAQTLVRAESQYRSATGRSTERDSDGFDKVVQAVTNAVAGWMDVLWKWHSEPGRTSYDRNYLLLASVYDGAPIENVHDRITSLGHALGEKNEGPRLTGQQGPGLIQLARQIDAIPLPDGNLRFPGPGFAEAVVRYFWRDRPELIGPFTNWTAKLCLGLHPDQQARLAQRMVPWALRHAQASRQTKLLYRVAEDWSQDGGLVGHAHDLLVAAILDPEVGQLTRNATTRWASSEESSAHLLRTLARVFQTLVPAHPGLMLRRLGDLAVSQKDGVAEAVGTALNALWEEDELRPQVRKTLDSWFASDQNSLQRSAASAFMNLALQHDDFGQPALLSTPEGGVVPDWVIRGWRTALEAEEPTALGRRACAVWLDAAAATGDDAADRIAATLVSAVHETYGDHLRGRRVLNLYRLAEHWLIRGEALDWEGRSRFRAALVRSVEAADPRAPGREMEGEPASA
ncbi:hypothetical protein ABT236_14855 [Streptomyces sp. NPDC001523]|uniref:hypothetical protein n=1 Tax=Streptomyces sp. NPDC001523 TaxID=3154383 RepID=UPI003324D4E1